MVGACPPTPVEKCRLCRNGLPCPVHDEKSRPDYKALSKKKRRRVTGSKKGKKRISRGQIMRKKMKSE